LTSSLLWGNISTEFAFVAQIAWALIMVTEIVSVENESASDDPLDLMT